MAVFSDALIQGNFKKSEESSRKHTEYLSQGQVNKCSYLNILVSMYCGFVCFFLDIWSTEWSKQRGDPLQTAACSVSVSIWNVLLDKSRTVMCVFSDWVLWEQEAGSSIPLSLWSSRLKPCRAQDSCQSGFGVCLWLAWLDAASMSWAEAGGQQVVSN